MSGRSPSPPLSGSRPGPPVPDRGHVLIAPVELVSSPADAYRVFVTGDGQRVVVAPDDPDITVIDTTNVADPISTVLVHAARDAERLDEVVGIALEEQVRARLCMSGSQPHVGVCACVQLARMAERILTAVPDREEPAP